MASIVVNGDTSGAVTLSAPAVAGTVTVTLPSTSGVMAVGGGTITTLTTTSDITVNGLTVGRGGAGGAANTAYGASAIPIAPNSGVTAIGSNAGKLFNTASDTGQSTFVGYFAGASCVSGTDNTFIGGSAGTNTTGSKNTAVGSQALQLSTTASNSTAVGYQAGYTNVTGASNTFLGYVAGYSSTSSNNVFIGAGTGYSTTGSSNTFIGRSSAGTGSGENVTTGSKNTILGGYSGSAAPISASGSNYIVLSDGDGWVGLHIKNGVGTSLPSVASGAGTNALRYSTATSVVSYDTSSARYKDNIRDSVYGLSHVMQMRSAQFEYKDTGRSDVGLIAEELDPIIPELVGKNKDGEPDSVSYDRMVSVLVKSIQELKAEVDSLKAQINGASA